MELVPLVDKKPDTVRRWIAQTNPMPVDHARDAINLIVQKNPEDLELAEFFCPPHHIIIRAVDYKVSHEDRRRLQAKLITYIGEAFKELEKNGGSKNVKGRGPKLVHKWLNKVRQAAAELDEMTKQEVK